MNISSTNNIQIRTLVNEIRNQLAPDLESAQRYDTDYTSNDTTKD
ncbi:hypothetical protein [Natronomonas salina]|nr:hypothetical protein [Natronomonas salina]